MAAARPEAERGRGPGAGVGRTVLREQVKSVLLQRILARQYAPGERLVETRIAQEFGVSQAPVREALRDLELLRFVESEPFRGSRIREVSDEELIEVYPIRAALEDVAARGAAVRLDGKVQALEKEVQAMARARNLVDQVEHDVAFHRLIVEAAGNSRLIEMWSSLQVEARTMISAVRTGLDAHEIADMHVPIVEALRRRDPDAAAREIRSHVERFGAMLAERRAQRS
jgi:DNA-binding GntR family transcriptional regulator